MQDHKCRWWRVQRIWHSSSVIVEWHWWTGGAWGPGKKFCNSDPKDTMRIKIQETYKLIHTNGIASCKQMWKKEQQNGVEMQPDIFVTGALYRDPVTLWHWATWTWLSFLFWVISGHFRASQSHATNTDVFLAFSYSSHRYYTVGSHCPVYPGARFCFSFLTSVLGM